MCGIIAVLRRRSRRSAPDAQALRAAATAALAGLPEAVEPLAQPAGLLRAAERLEKIDRLLWGPPGIECLLGDPALEGDLAAVLDRFGDRLGQLEAALDGGDVRLPPDQLEAVNAALVRLQDAVWAVRCDRLHTAHEVRELAGADAGRAAIEAFASIQMALSALDRLEVRGRDSSGLHVLVTGHGLDLRGSVQDLLESRLRDPLFTSTAVRTPDGHLSFVYKAAAEIGELGDNGNALRDAIRHDVLLHQALASPDAEATVLGHTRWASVGIISQPNAHPLNQEEVDRTDGPYVTAVLNGDVDNYADLKAHESLAIQPEITTDAKVIPVLVSRRLAEGKPFDEAFRLTVSSFVGSVAVGASAAAAPDRLMLALRGSGQALYVGLCEDAYIVASEPYGLVEETSTYLRLDGETPGNPDNPSASQGQIVLLARDGAGDAEAIQRSAYDGTPLPVRRQELHHAEITTRDIDRGSFRHYLLKEITEAPRSFRKTLRGKIVDGDGGPRVRLGDETLSPELRRRLQQGALHQVLVIGQGTAAVAGQGVAALMTEALAGAPLQVQALPATELSGFRMREDMSDTLVVAISQSGTTTDTNRTVDLVRARGATVLGIVNRRNSDLCDKADGVLYTSDGRDVEMSVASTKAFYSQVAAGALLAYALADEIGHHTAARTTAMLDALRAMPAAMQNVLDQREAIGRAAQHAPPRRYWAVVGNGNNRIAAAEIRIKLSELCYKSIACDATEDKKHIDLSAEPFILVCAAGLTGSNADDVAKEVAIYRAHKATPVVVASAGESRFDAAIEVIGVPAVHPSLDFVLSAVVGHLLGYEAALAIDALARPLREARAAIERLSLAPRTGDDVLAELDIRDCGKRFFQALALCSYDGQLEASTAVRVASLLRYAEGSTPLESFSLEFGRVGTPAVVVEELTQALTRAIEELTRPVDAIKHQAKTVTVGISRSDEQLLTVPLIAALLAAGAPRDNLSYRELKTLAALDPAVHRVAGHTRYHIEGSLDDGATAHVVGKGGIASDIPSRTDKDPRLRGTKLQVAIERKTLVARGASDQRTVIMVPEVADGRVVGLTLLHVQLQDTISTAAMRGVLRGYRNRYDALRNAVTETEPSFRESLLEHQPVVDLLTTPIHVLAERWR